MEIYIIRHGETDANKICAFQGSMDTPLNEYGIMLAEETGKGLNNLKFDAAFSSPLSRAKQTCEIILGETKNDCPIIYDKRIEEINLGDFEGKTINDLTTQEEQNTIKLFFSDPRKIGNFPNGESIQDVITRTHEFIMEISKLNYNRVLVASHGCAIRCMLNFLYPDKDIIWHNRKVPPNCSISIVDAVNDEMSLIGDDIIFYDTSLLVDRYKEVSK